jgi:glycine/serine hydroxymethyltransferase
MKETEMARIGDWIAHVLEAPEDEDRRHTVREEVRELAASFPLFHELAGA